jgi:probable HAF family extracellular repeat protein
MTRRRLAAALLCAVILIVAGVAVRYAGRPRALYRVTFLPAAGAVQTRAYAINDSRQVAGVLRMKDDAVRVVLWDKDDQIREIDFFPGGYSVAELALNNAGQMAGTVIDPNHTYRSFFWDTDGRRHVLNPSPDAHSQIGALNNRGQVVGQWAAVRGPRHAFVWDKSAGMQDLGTFGGIESLACGINDVGQIVGFSSDSSGTRWRAFLHDPNLGTQDLGPTKFGPAVTCRINNRGFVVGQFGSAVDEGCVSTWSPGAGSCRLPSVGGDSVRLGALSETDQFFLNIYHAGFGLWGRRFGDGGESYLWEAARQTRGLSRHLGRADVTGLTVEDINRDGVMVGGMSVEKLPTARAVLLEPIK